MLSVWLGLASFAVVLGVFAWMLHRRHVDRWLVPYLLETGRRGAPDPDQEIHVLLCVTDHWEPKYRRATPEVAWNRVQRWVTEYPRQFSRFRDSSGRCPKHTFFFPIEEYEEEYLDALAGLCREGFGEVEVHLHHRDDTAENLRKEILRFKEVLAQRHGLLARDRQTGELAYGFIHGNWALCNSRPDGDWCGVNEELAILKETGCYADFTFPSAPSATQPPRINRLYYAWDRLGQACSHFQGQDAGVGLPPRDALLMVQGPLLLNWNNRKWGLAPRLENACLQDTQPPSLHRLDLWLKARVQVPARPDWFFIKLHAHGVQENSIDTLLGEPMVAFHEALAHRAAENARFHYHYVTAREVYNLVKAAESGWTGSVAEALNYQLTWNGGCPEPASISVPR